MEFVDDGILKPKWIIHQCKGLLAIAHTPFPSRLIGNIQNLARSGLDAEGGRCGLERYWGSVPRSSVAHATDSDHLLTDRALGTGRQGAGPGTRLTVRPSLTAYDADRD